MTRFARRLSCGVSAVASRATRITPTVQRDRLSVALRGSRCSRSRACRTGARSRARRRVRRRSAPLFVGAEGEPTTFVVIRVREAGWRERQWEPERRERPKRISSTGSESSERERGWPPRRARDRRCDRAARRPLAAQVLQAVFFQGRADFGGALRAREPFGDGGRDALREPGVHRSFAVPHAHRSRASGLSPPRPRVGARRHQTERRRDVLRGVPQRPREAAQRIHFAGNGIAPGELDVGVEEPFVVDDREIGTGVDRDGRMLEQRAGGAKRVSAVACSTGERPMASCVTASVSGAAASIARNCSTFAARSAPSFVSTARCRASRVRYRTDPARRLWETTG